MKGTSPVVAIGVDRSGVGGDGTRQFVRAGEKKRAPKIGEKGLSEVRRT
jgi:hypothetical protein